MKHTKSLLKRTNPRDLCSHTSALKFTNNPTRTLGTKLLVTLALGVSFFAPHVHPMDSALAGTPRTGHETTHHNPAQSMALVPSSGPSHNVETLTLHASQCDAQGEREKEKGNGKELASSQMADALSVQDSFSLFKGLSILMGCETYSNKHLNGQEQKQSLFAHLPEEILNSILAYVTNPRDLRNLGLTCKALHTLAGELLETTAFPEKWRQSHEALSLRGHTDYIRSLIKLDDTTIASGSDDNTIKIWNIFPNHKGGAFVKTLAGDRSCVTSLIKLDDNTIVSGSSDNTIKIWNISPNHLGDPCVRTLAGHTDMVSSLIKLNDSTIASGSWDRTIKIWNIWAAPQEDPCVRTLAGHTNWINSVIRLDDNTIASGSSDKTIKIWNISPNHQGDRCVRTLTNHTCSVTSLIKLNDNTIASGSWDYTIKIWNIWAAPQEAAYVRTLTGHKSLIYSLIKLDDNTVASGSDDRTIKIWNISPEGKASPCVKTLSGHSRPIYSLVKLDNSTIVSGSWDKTIKIWRQEPAPLTTRHRITS